MLIEQNTFEYTYQGFQDAKLFLKRIGQYTPLYETYDMGTIIAEANKIKLNQEILTEGN